MKSHFLHISNTTKKKARGLFPSKVVAQASELLENETIETIDSEFIVDSDNDILKECLLFMINRTKQNEIET